MPKPALDLPELDPAWILFQGSGILVLDKPAGLPVHRGTSHDLGLIDLVEEWARSHPGQIQIRAGKPVRPAHRLDREASGVLLLGLTKQAARALQAALAAHEVRKRYVAVVAGPVDALDHLRGTVRSRLRGSYRHLPAELSFRRLAGDERLSLVEVEPIGGRTHQIRALFAAAGRPLAGDLRYGKPKPSRQFLEKFALEHFLLHSWEVTLPASVLGGERTFVAPLPAAFVGLVEKKGWKVPETAGGRRSS